MSLRSIIILIDEGMLTTIGLSLCLFFSVNYDETH